MAKFESVMQVLEERIAHGDYLVREFPSERRLAEEVGVSYMTARKATQALMDRGLLRRKENGRLDAVPPGAQGSQSIALLSPSFSSRVHHDWLADLMFTADSFGLHVRPIEYVHYNDAIFQQLLTSVDAIFLICLAENIPTDLVDQLRQGPARVVVLDEDLSHLGLPSVLPRPVTAIDTVLDHLQSQGHDRILALNTQPISQPITARLQRLVRLGGERGLQVDVMNDPVQSFGNALEQAVGVMENLLNAGQLQASAIIGVTESAAIGAHRVLLSRGLRIPADLSVCSIANEGMCRYMTPTITAPVEADAKVDISLCLRQIIAGKWDSDLLLCPPTITLFRGESTAPPR